MCPRVVPVLIGIPVEGRDEWPVGLQKGPVDLEARGGVGAGMCCIRRLIDILRLTCKVSYGSLHLSLKSWCQFVKKSASER